MQKYSTYKPSNVEWLGDIPSHWKVDRLRDIASINSETLGSDTPKDYQLRYIDISNVNYSGVISFDAIETLEFENAPSRAKRITKAKDTIISSVRPNLQAVCYIDFDDTNLICSTGFNVVRTRNEILDSRFLFYCLISDISKDFFVSRANGVGYPAIGDYDFGSLKISFPTKSEQIAIAAYLDHATANIDHVIATKQKQLEKLEQYKQSKIHECVTKGLNPDVTLKPSGINWIGDVPSHWKVERLKYVVSKIGSGVTPKGGAAVYSTTGIPLIRSQNVHFDGLNFSDIACITEEIHDDMSGSKVKRGDVLLNITGASIGRCNYYNLDDEANVNQHVCILRPNELMSTNFLYYLMMSEVGQSQIFSGFKGSGREGLGNEAIKVFKIPLPKTKEQREISDYLDFFSENIKKEKSIIEQQIEKLKQYRRSLIHECVTGKIKVTE